MHLFRKYLSNRGSALFMVISTMTALMITCMAMYFTVVSSRSVQYAIFNQKQSYQASTSLYDMLSSYIYGAVNDGENGVGGTTLGEEMMKLANANNKTDILVATFKGSDFEDNYMGEDIVVEISFQEKYETTYAFDIVIITTVNGAREVLHDVIEVTTDGETETIVSTSHGDGSCSPLFAATGYVPNDVYLSKGRFLTDVTFDNEMTYMGAYAGTELFNPGDFNCAGSLEVLDGMAWRSYHGLAVAGRKSVTTGVENVTFAVRNRFTYNGQSISFTKGDRILVGGDCYLGAQFQNVDVYVRGDLYLTSDSYDGTTFYVDGYVYLPSSGNLVNNQQWKHIYCNKEVRYDNRNGNVITGKSKITSGEGSWKTLADDDDSYLTFNEMTMELSRRTATTTYYKWIIDDAKDGAHPEVNLDKSIGNYQTLDFSKEGFTPGGESVINIVHSGAYTKDQYKAAGYTGDYDKEMARWKTGCVLEDIKGLDSLSHAFIIIDTGDNPDNVYTMRLLANRTGPDKKKTIFSWTGERGDNCAMYVLVRGNGTLVLDIPEKVQYYQTNHGGVMHYNWFMLSCDKAYVPGTRGNGDSSLTASHIEVAGDPGTAKYLHLECGKKSDGSLCLCNLNDNITVVTAMKKDDDGNDVPLICDKCNKEEMKKASCAKHSGHVTYCPVCDLHLVCENADKVLQSTDDAPVKPIYNFCNERVDIDAVRNSGRSNLWKNTVGGGTPLTQKGSIQAPNCNIYLVSCDESSDIVMSYKPDGTKHGEENYFYGYVYAPYVTYLADYGFGGSKALFIGGMTVSDYVFFSEATLQACRPDKSANELMSPASFAHPISSGKGWKIKLDLKTH